jgi:WD40 repeat protein
LPYKQVFARLYNADALSSQSLDQALSFLPDGRLSVSLSPTPDLIDLGIPEPQAPQLSTVVMSGTHESPAAETPDGRYYVEVGTFPHEGTNEYWLIHSDEANGKYKRAKLNSEWRPDSKNQPRVVVSPNGSFFIVDDSGTVRLYTSAHFLEAGTFQVAHANTENRIVSLAVSPDERLIAGLCAWKDIVLYSVAERKVAFVRQIRDEIGWYDPTRAHILFAGAAEVLVTVGIAAQTTSPESPHFSVNAFKLVPLNIA